MKILKFNESQKEMISFEDVKKWIKDTYTKMSIAEMIDDEINSGNWIDDEQMKDEGYESNYDYYIDYCNGEAELAVMEKIVGDLKSKFNLGFDVIGDKTNIYDFLREEFDINDF